MQRDHFLASIRAANRLAGDPRAPEVPAMPISRPDTDLPSRLAAELERVQGIVERVSTMDEARAAVVKIVEQLGARRVIRADTAWLGTIGLDAELAKIGAEVSVDRGEDENRAQAFAADVGITAADYGVAESGSLAIVTRPGQERSTSLLPPTHIALLRAQDVVYELGELFARASADHGTLPSALTLITGASRTGDIEQILTIGVHGPGEVYLVLVDSKASPAE